MRFFILIFSVFIVLGLGSPSWALSTVFSQAILHWDTLTFSGIPIVFFDQDSNTWVNVRNDDLPSVGIFSGAVKEGWVPISEDLTAPGAMVHGETNDRVVGGYTSVFANGTNPTMRTGGWESTWRTGRFRAEESGNLTVEVDFTIIQNVTTEHIGETALGTAEVRIQLGGFSPSDGRWVRNDAMDGSSFTESLTGTLSITDHFFAREESRFFSNTGTLGRTFSPIPHPSTIPEPSTMVLFCSGVAGLVAWRYKSSRNP